MPFYMITFKIDLKIHMEGSSILIRVNQTMATTVEYNPVQDNFKVSFPSGTILVYAGGKNKLEDYKGLLEAIQQKQGFAMSVADPPTTFTTQTNGTVEISGDADFVLILENHLMIPALAQLIENHSE